MFPIGIFGQKHNGKSTFAEMLRNHIPLTRPYHRASFARPIKEIVADIFRVRVEAFKHLDTPPIGWNVNMREALQRIGQGFRDIDPNVLINEAFHVNPINSIYDDGRYENEHTAIKARGGKCILIIRPADLVTFSTRPSERWVGEQAFFNLAKMTCVDQYILGDEYKIWDAVIINNGTTVELDEKAKNLAFDLFKGNSRQYELGGEG